MPNTFAYLMLIMWPVISLVLFTRLSPLKATLWSLLGGYMILPERTYIDFPLIPTLDKESFASLAALAGCYFIAKNKVPLLPRSGPEKWLIILLLVCPLITTITNPEPFGSLPGMRLYDAVSYIMFSYIEFIPFLLGMHLIKTYDDQIVAFRWLVVAGLIYTVPALVEIRLSPQLHTWVYGFFPHQFLQQIRFGGFRPVIFMRHGLVVAFFFTITIMAAISLWRDKQGFYGNSRETKKFTLFAVIYLVTILVLCKTVSALIYCIVFFLAVACIPLPLTRWVAIFLIAVVITYPLSSMLGIFPHEELVNLALNINDDRAQSLEFRFMNENILLEHARHKILFGWGGWGRNRPFDGLVTDGYWIIVLGSFGLLTFIAHFGLPTLGIFRGLRASQKLRENEGKKLLVFYALFVAIIMVNQIVNTSMSSYLWFLIGGLLGRANYVLARSKISTRE